MAEQQQLHGMLPVFQTPYHEDGTVDYETLKKEIDWLFEQGSDGVVMAMVSEVLRLDEAERLEVAGAVCRYSEGKGSVVISVGAESTRLAVRLAKEAEQAGATAVMAIPPVATGAGEDELKDYYRALFDAINIPVVIQDASGYVGQPMSIAMQADMLKEYGAERALYKPEASPIGPRLSQLRDATGGDARIFEGSGGVQLLDSYRRGIAGTMPGADLITAQVALWRALLAEDYDRAYEVYEPLCSLVALENTLDSYLAIEKHLLVKQGIFKNEIVRGPRAFKLDDETRAEVDRRFDRLMAAVDRAGASANQ